MNDDISPNDGPETQLGEVRARLAKTQLLLWMQSGLLVLALAGIGVLAFFPEWLPGRRATAKAPSPGAFKGDVSLDLLKDVRDMREYVSRDMDEVKRQLKRLVDESNKVQADNVALRTQLTSLNTDLRKDLNGINSELRKDMDKFRMDQLKVQSEKKK